MLKGRLNDNGKRDLQRNGRKQKPLRCARRGGPLAALAQRPGRALAVPDPLRQQTVQMRNFRP